MPEKSRNEVPKLTGSVVPFSHIHKRDSHEYLQGWKDVYIVLWPAIRHFAAVLLRLSSTHSPPTLSFHNQTDVDQCCALRASTSASPHVIKQSSQQYSDRNEKCTTWMLIKVGGKSAPKIGRAHV